MKKSIILLMWLYFSFDSCSFASKKQDVVWEFKEIEKDMHKLKNLITEFQSCFSDFFEKQPLSKGIIEVFKTLDQKVKNDKNLGKYLDSFVKELCEEKEGVMGIFSVNEIQKKFINHIFIDALNKPIEESWGNYFREICTYESQEYFEIFNLPYHQLLLKFFFDQRINHDFVFLKKNLYEAIVSNSRDSLSLSLKLLNKQQFGPKAN